MGVKTKPFRVSYDDLLEANLRVAWTLLRAATNAMLVLAFLALALVVCLVLETGPPVSSREIALIEIGAMSIVFIFALAGYVGRRRNVVLRRQLKDPFRMRFREQPLTIELEDGEMRFASASSSGVAKIDEYFSFGLKSGAVCLYHPGYGSMAILRPENFDTPNDWEYARRRIDQLPRLSV